MPRRFLVWAVCVGAAVSSGCGTMANTAYFTPGEGGKKVYGGVQVDWDVAVKQNESAWVTAAAFADLPLSAIGDTLSLPYLLALYLAADGRPADPNVRMSQLLHESEDSGPHSDGWRRSRSNNPMTYERLQGAIGP